MSLFEQQVFDVLNRSSLSLELGSSTESDKDGSFGACYLSDMSNTLSGGDELMQQEIVVDELASVILECADAVAVDTKDAEMATTSPMSGSLTDLDFEETIKAPVGARKRALLKPIPTQKQFKNWKNPTPSKYCHSCGAVPRADKVVCRNSKVGSCRKMFCRTCIEKIYGQWGNEHVEQDWECTHCMGACPEKASCRYYAKRNQQRRLKAQAQTQKLA